MKKVEKIWMDGQMLGWDDAKVHVLTHTLHYGLGVFEGIRCYALDTGKCAIFRLREHIDRLFASAHILTMTIPFSRDAIVDACLETVRANGLGHCYLRPIVFLGDGEMGIAARNAGVHIAIAAWEWGSYLGDEGIKRGIRCKVSSFQRPHVNAQLSKAKASGHYVNSILAKREAMQSGYDEAILLDAQGYVCEASGENLFMISDGVLVTPSFGASLLGGITRSTIMTLAKRDGIEVQERLISRDELYIADEVFLCGTAAEVTPVREVDDRMIGQGARGPMTERLQTLYFQAVKTERGPDASWLSVV